MHLAGNHQSVLGNHLYLPQTNININKSIINHSAISSIQNNSMIAISELMDLPRQLNNNNNKNKK